MARIPSPGQDPKREEQRLARKARRHAERRRAIMGAARRLLAAQGTESFTVSAVAAAAEVSKPAVYYYFDSKEELVAVLAAEALEAETGALRAAIASASDGVDALARAVGGLLDHHRADLEGYRAAYLWPQVLGVTAHPMHSTARIERDQLNADLARRLDADSRLQSASSAHRSQALVAAAFAAAHGLLAAACAAGATGAQEALPLSELGDVLDTLLRCGLAAHEPR